MIKRPYINIAAIVLAVFTWVNLGGQDTIITAQQPRQEVSDTLEKALLWKIEGDGINPSFLFGTIHMITSDKFFLPEGTEEALEQSGQVVFEIDMDEMTDLTALMGLLLKAPMPNGLRISDMVSEEDYSMLEAHFNAMGLPMMFLDRIKPLFLTVFASSDMSLDGTGGMTSYEMEFYDKALQLSKPVGGLETMEYQMSVFDSIPYEEQAEMLVEMIRDQDAGDEEFQRLIDTYTSQDVDLLAELVVSSEGGVGDHEAVLLINRNRNWIPAMIEMMADEPVFFAVGAGHLGGKEGVIRLLQAEGYRLTPIREASQVSRGKRF